jgi:cytochrome P450
VEIFTPLDPKMLADPYSVYAELRRTDPVHWHEQLAAYVITRHADCQRILVDPSTFASDFRKIGEEQPDPALNIQSVDAPDHTAIRRSVLAALKKTDIDAWAADVRQTASGLLRSLGSEFDFVTDFAEPLGTKSMLMLFGLSSPHDSGSPIKDNPAYVSAIRNLILSMDAGLAPEREALGTEAREYLSELIRPWTTSAPPAAGLLSNVDFSVAQSDDHRMFLLNTLRSLFVAGASSSSSMLGNAARALIDDDFFSSPEPRDITPLMAHELVRFAGPPQALSRAVVKDAEIGGQALRHGDIVVIVIASANRDEAVFDPADKLDFTRNPMKHLGFSAGIHACMGARFAIAVVSGVLSEVAANFHAELAGEPVQRPTATQRGFDKLPVRLKAR